MQKVDDLDQRFLGLILAGNVGKGDAGLLFHIDLGLVFANAQTADPAAAHSLGHAAHQQTEQQIHDGNRNDPRDDERDNGADLLNDLHLELCAVGAKLLDQRGRILIWQQAGVVQPLLGGGILGLLARGDNKAVRLELHQLYLILVDHVEEFIVPDLGEIGV